MNQTQIDNKNPYQFQNMIVFIYTQKNQRRLDSSIEKKYKEIPILICKTKILTELEHFKNVQSLVEQTTKKIVSFIQSSQRNSRQPRFIGGIIDTVSGAAKGVYKTGKDIVTTVANIGKDLVDKGIYVVTSVVNKAVEVAVNTATTVWQTGKDVVQDTVDVASDLAKPSFWTSIPGYVIKLDFDNFDPNTVLNFVQVGTQLATLKKRTVQALLSTVTPYKNNPKPMKFQIPILTPVLDLPYSLTQKYKQNSKPKSKPIPPTPPKNPERAYNKCESKEFVNSESSLYQQYFGNKLNRDHFTKYKEDLEGNIAKIWGEIDKNIDEWLAEYDDQDSINQSITDLETDQSNKNATIILNQESLPQHKKNIQKAKDKLTGFNEVCKGKGIKYIQCKRKAKAEENAQQKVNEIQKMIDDIKQNNVLLQAQIDQNSNDLQKLRSDLKTVQDRQNLYYDAENQANKEQQKLDEVNELLEIPEIPKPTVDCLKQQDLYKIEQSSRTSFQENLKK